MAFQKMYTCLYLQTKPSQDLMFLLRHPFTVKMVWHSIRNGIGTQGVKPVGMPTDWVSSLVVVKKPNGKVKRIHQPKTAQQYKCRHYPLPVIDDLVKGQSFHHV